MSTAMGRRRGGRFSDRPQNVDITTVGDVTYFSYVFPDGQKRSIGNSRDTEGAFAKATALNGHFAQQRVALDVTTLVQNRTPRPRVSARNPTMPTLVAEFRKHDPKRKHYSARTLSELDYKLAAYAVRWKDKTVGELQTTDFAAFLNTLTDNAYVKHRSALLRLMQFAGHQGYRTDNPMAVTLEKEESEKVRERHTWEGYKKILKAAPDWLQRAMRIGLYSLQRREDVVLLHKTENKVDLQANTITILQRKTRNYKNPVWIEIEMGPELRAAVEDCLRSDVPCPYLIHHRPGRINQKIREAKPHPFAVLPDFLSREFRRVRDKCGAYDHLTPEQRPTFHELRALGTHLYREAGFSDEYVMALSGHAKRETLERYQKDHQEAKPRRVSAGLTKQS